MALRLENLDARTREFMLDELALDVDSGTLLVSPRLTEKGRADHYQLLREAISSRDEVWLANALHSPGRMYTTEVRRNPGKAPTVVRVPVTAPATLADREFTRFYARGVCRRALEDGITNVIVYRARLGEAPRPKSQGLIGTEINAQALLEDLRAHQEIESGLRLPPASDSGLCVRLP